MYKQTWFIVAFSIFTALIGVFITFVRKYMFKKHDVETVYFVDKNYGLTNGLKSAMNFSILHPVSPNMCELHCEIERID